MTTWLAGEILWVFPMFFSEAVAAFREWRGAVMSGTLLDKREVRIRRMFGHIAPSYDFLNHLLSLNIDHYWSWRVTRLVPPAGDAPILDLCTGTGDQALAYDRAAGGRIHVVGADFCHEMLTRAAGKSR